MTTGGKVPLPTYETLLTEAIRSLAIDSGTVTIPPPAGVAVLQDDSKNWAVNVHANRLVKIIRGAGAGQLRVILSNSDKLLTVNQAWVVSPNQTSVYVILGIDLTTIFGTGSGAVYVNSDTATNDNPRHFEATSRKLAWAVISVETNDQLFGNAAGQAFPLAAAGTMGIGRVDLSTLYFRNRNAGQNGTVYILGVED
jgi:hypothetical protein